MGFGVFYSLRSIDLVASQFPGSSSFFDLIHRPLCPKRYLASRGVSGKLGVGSLFGLRQSSLVTLNFVAVVTSATPIPLQLTFSDFRGFIRASHRLEL